MCVRIVAGSYPLTALYGKIILPSLSSNRTPLWWLISSGSQRYRVEPAKRQEHRQTRAPTNKSVGKQGHRQTRAPTKKGIDKKRASTNKRTDKQAQASSRVHKGQIASVPRPPRAEYPCTRQPVPVVLETRIPGVATQPVQALPLEALRVLLVGRLLVRPGHVHPEGHTVQCPAPLACNQHRAKV